MVKSLIFGELNANEKINEIFKVCILPETGEAVKGVAVKKTVSPIFLESETSKEITRRDLIKEKIEKNLKTVFVANLPVEVTEKKNSKNLMKEFQKFGEIDSIRFRSIAFNTKMPRKQAFIAKKLHDSRQSLNAYIVFNTKENAAAAISEMNGKIFMGRHLRVDFTEKKSEKQHDAKKCVFIGNLGFNTEDEALWEFFSDAGEIENVRIIRDHKTNVGKGFGYVQFKEKSSISLALKLNGTNLNSRPIRISRAVERLSNAKNPASVSSKSLEGKRSSRPSTAPAVDNKKIKILNGGGVMKKPRWNPRN